MLGVDAWCELAAEAAALPDAATRDALLEAVVLLGMTPAERRELAARIVRRADPAGRLLHTVVERAHASSDPRYAVRPPATPRQMDAALELSHELLAGSPESLAERLASSQTAVLAALPPDAAGGLVLGLLEQAAHLHDLGARGETLSAIGYLCYHLSLERLPVARVLLVGALLEIESPEVELDVAWILGRVAASRLVAGCADAIRQGTKPSQVVRLLARTAELRQRNQALASPPSIEPVAGPPLAPAPPAPAPPAPAPSRGRGLRLPRSRAESGRGGFRLESLGLKRWRSGQPELAALGQSEPARVATRTAYPRIDVDSHQARPEVAVVDEPFDVTVGLARRKDPTLTQTGALAFAVGTQVELELVLVYDPGSLVAQGETRLRLTVTDADPDPSATLTFVARWGEDLPPERRIGVHYLRDGQLVGIAWRSFVVVDDPSDVATAPVPEARESALLDLAPLLGADLPDLILSVCRSDGAASGRFVWTAYPGASGVTVPDAPRTADLEGDLQGFVVELRRGIQFSKGAADDYLELAGRAARIGRAIPAGVRAALRAVVTDPGRTTAPSVLLLTEELSLPWELAALDPPLETPWGGRSPFLGAHAAIGRWPLSEHKPRPTPRASVAVRRAAVLTADYTGVTGWAKLDNAVAEAADVARLFTPPAVTVRPGVWEVVDLLRGNPPAEVLHVALHGQFDAQGGQEGLVLLGTDGTGDLTPQWRFLTPAQVENGDLDAGPFVFLNACQVGSDKRVLGDYGGFASTLLRIGASGVVAPLWSVDDDVAATLARDFYAATWTGASEEPVSAAEAVRRVRATYTEDAVRAQTPGVTATLVAFQVFGHPRLRLTPGC